MQTLRMTTQLQTTIPVGGSNEKKELVLCPPSWDMSSEQSSEHCSIYVPSCF